MRFRSYLWKMVRDMEVRSRLPVRSPPADRKDECGVNPSTAQVAVIRAMHARQGQKVSLHLIMRM